MVGEGEIFKYPSLGKKVRKEKKVEVFVQRLFLFGCCFFLRTGKFSN